MSESSSRPPSSVRAAWIAGAYLVVSLVWIASSDQFGPALFSSYEAITRFQTYKGIGFVVVSAVLLFFAVRGAGAPRGVVTRFCALVTAAEGRPWNNATSRSSVGGADVADGATVEKTVGVPASTVSSPAPPGGTAEGGAADGGTQKAPRSAFEAVTTLA